MNRHLTDEEQRQRDEAKKREELEAELAERERERLEEQETNEARIEKRLVALRTNHEAQRRLAIEVSRQKPKELPPLGWTAEDFIDEDLGEPVPVVEQLHYDGGNTLLVAEFKTGKTTLEINLAASLVDGFPFLGRFATQFEGNVCFLNYEMDRRQFRQWLEDADIENTDRIVPLNLRGWTLPFWDDKEMDRLASWLLEGGVKFIILDPAARAWRGLVDDENDNMKVSEFFGALDELKRLANCPNLLLAAHTPRTGADRARGSGEIEAWPDHNWYLGKVKGISERSFRAEGRDVQLEETLLSFGADTRRFSASGATAEHVRMRERMAEAINIVDDEGPMESMEELVRKMKGKTDLKRRAIDMAIERGFLRIVRQGAKKRIEFVED